MTIDQISVFLENRAGQLADVVQTLAEADINIRGLSLADTSDFGILRLIVCEQKKAIDVLLRSGFTMGRTSVLAIVFKDEGGALNQLLQLISKADINVEYMYGCTSDIPGKAIMIFRFDRIDEAERILRGSNVEILSPDILCNDR